MFGFKPPKWSPFKKRKNHTRFITKVKEILDREGFYLDDEASATGLYSLGGKKSWNIGETAGKCTTLDEEEWEKIIRQDFKTFLTNKGQKKKKEKKSRPSDPVKKFSNLRLQIMSDSYFDARVINRKAIMHYQITDELFKY